tara:strand:+ start:1049 stop:1264 length:216 start_codon:yes stop_codon:yes gene_type:complete
MDRAEIKYIKKNATWVTRRKAAKLTTLTERTIDRYIKNGRVYAKKLGSQRVIIAKESLSSDIINSPKPLFI